MELLDIIRLWIFFDVASIELTTQEGLELSLPSKHYVRYHKASHRSQS